MLAQLPDEKSFYVGKDGEISMAYANELKLEAIISFPKNHNLGAIF